MMKVVFTDMGEVFKAPFRFLPYCPSCYDELGGYENKCGQCGMDIEWNDPYAEPITKEKS
jgi:hypothetical protein